MVHLSWEDASAGFGGGWKVVDMDERRLAPVFLEPGRNIALDAAGLGGGPFGAKWPVQTNHEFHGLAVDGDPTTSFEEADIKETREWPFLGVGLGGVLPINRVVFYPTTEHQDRFPEYLRLYVFGGDPSRLANPFGSLRDFDLVAQEEDNRTSRIEVTMSTRFVHTVMLEIGDPQSPDRDFRSGSRPWQIAEFEIYGDGYAPNAFLRSRGSGLRFDYQRGADSLVRAQGPGCKGGDSHPKREGQRPEPLLAPHRAGHRGQLPRPPGPPADPEAVRGPAADGAGGNLPGPGRLELLVGPVCLWRQRRHSSPLPGPRRFLQLDVQFESNYLAGGELAYLEFEATSPPVVHQVVGEVSPIEVVAGEETEFVLAFLPTITEAEPGFDRFVLSTPGELIAVDSVRVNSERVEYQTGDQLLPGHRIELVLPRMEAADSGRPVEVFFRARVFRFGTVFEGELHDSRRPGEVGQGMVDGGRDIPSRQQPVVGRCQSVGCLAAGTWR